jgi:hypothetical protein
MMDIISESVKKIEALLEHSGCMDAGVLLDVENDTIVCQFERGASMSASFGGKSTDFATFDPIRARTKVSFMFGASLDSPPVRGAACAIINVVLGFLCMSRVLHSCQESCHAPCRDLLMKEIAGKRLFYIGRIGACGAEPGNYGADSPSDAELILLNGEGLIAEGTGDIIAGYKDPKRIICVGPSTAGIARLYEIEHWCPFGRN